MTTSLVLGVDGGNTKSVALVAAPDGTIRGAGRALGIADIYQATSVDAAMDVLADAIAAALGQAGGDRRDIGPAAFSMAGADWPEDMKLIEGALAERGIGASRRVVNDAVGGLAGAIPTGPGVVVAVGSGGATGARGLDGQVWHSSYWQDVQGAGELSSRALYAVCRAELGIDPPTALRERLLAQIDVSSVEDLLHSFTAHGAPRATIRGQLVRALLDEAAAGDAVARGIVVDHGTGLGLFASAAARKVGIGSEPFRLALTGGLLRHPGSVLPDAIVAAVRERHPAVERVAPRFEPAVGALLLALDPAPGSETLERVAGSLPGPELYEYESLSPGS